MMKRKTKRIIAWVILALFVVFLSVELIVALLPPNTDEVEESVTNTVEEPLVIKTTPPSTHGTLIVKSEETNEVVYEYEGDNINIIRTGRRGEDILVEVILPSNNLCECLEEGGNSYE